MKPTTIAQEELDRFLQVIRDVFRRATVASPRGRALLATPTTGKYPYVYTRDLAVAIAALCELDELEVARDFCRFLLRVQSPGRLLGPTLRCRRPAGTSWSAGGRHRPGDLGAADLRQGGRRRDAGRGCARADRAGDDLHRRADAELVPLPRRDDQLDPRVGRQPRATRSGTTAPTPRPSRSATASTAASGIDDWR